MPNIFDSSYYGVPPAPTPPAGWHPPMSPTYVPPPPDYTPPDYTPPDEPTAPTPYYTQTTSFDPFSGIGTWLGGLWSGYPRGNTSSQPSSNNSTIIVIIAVILIAFLMVIVYATKK